MKMDYTLKNPKDRVDKVQQIITEAPSSSLTPSYLDKLADYICHAADAEERRKKHILTDNHMVTVNKRELSFEGMVGRLENGEDGLYNFISNDKNIIFQPKVSIDAEDRLEIPELASLQESIAKVAEKARTAVGKKAYYLKKQLIEMRQDQYVIKNEHRKPIYCINKTNSNNKLDLRESVTVDHDGSVHSDGIISFFDENHIVALLCNYKNVYQQVMNDIHSDLKYVIEDFVELVKNTLEKKYPLYYDIVKYKTDGKQNNEIQALLYEKHGIKHSIEYISALWRKKIPKLIAEKATNDYLEYYFTFVERGKWKRCSRCGQIKLAHQNFFSKNKSSKDGWYSICKECRNKKKGD